MKYTIGELVKYDTYFGTECYRIRKVFPNFRGKNRVGYSIVLENPSSILYKSGMQVVTVREESIKPF